MPNNRSFARLVCLGVCSFAAVAEAAPTFVKVLTPTEAKLVNLSSPSTSFARGEPLRFTALRGATGPCESVRITVDGKSRIDHNPTFPYAVEISPRDPLYPTKPGKYDVVVEGLSASCTGKLTHTFGVHEAPAVAGPGVVTDVVVTGFKTPDATGTYTIVGHGMCRLRIGLFVAPYSHASSPLELEFSDTPVQLPYTMQLKHTAAMTGGEHVAEVYSLGSKWGGVPDDDSKKRFPSYQGCVISGPASAGNFAMYKPFPTFAPGTPPSKPGGNGGSPGGAPGGGGGGGGPKPATGKIMGLQVPGGSFAQDEPQKLAVSGQGGCALDLRIKRTEQGASFDKTWPVNPVALASTLYNGAHFETLAEGSYSASVTGKNGCTGTATIDFKVTPKTSTKTITGKPTVGFEKAPISGSAYKRTKDSNINFQVKVPQTIKDEPYASCCDIEYNYVNEYGGWEVLPNSPFNDSSFGLAITQPFSIVPKSVSGFKDGTQWRVRVRGYKFKTEFEWSDWVQFQTDQN